MINRNFVLQKHYTIYGGLWEGPQYTPRGCGEDLPRIQQGWIVKLGGPFNKTMLCIYTWEGILHMHGEKSEVY